MASFKKRIATGLVVAGLLCISTPAWSYAVGLTNGNSGEVIRWMTNTVTYYLHPSCSADLNSGTCLNALRDSFDEWEGHGCSALDFVESGTSSNLKLTAVGWDSNGKNELAFIENNAWQYGQYTLGVTAPYFYNDGQITEADIAFNGYLQTWTTSGATWSTDVKNVAVHEIGHMIGMQHMLGGYDSDNPPTMAPTADPYMKSQTPEADDIDGLCFLYSQGGWSCSSNADCPLINADGPQGEYYAGQLACQNGSCGGFSNEVPEGNAALGDSCAATYDCQSPLFCQPTSGSGGVCAEHCNPNSDSCPAGFECVAYQGSTTEGVCLEAQSGGGGNKSLGQSCTSSTECASDLCVQTGSQSVCMQMCSSDNDCGQSQTCSMFPGYGYGACIDGGGGSNGTGDKELGDDCGSPDECASGLCAGDGLAYICVQPCSGPGSCPSGYVCYTLQGGGGGCFPVDGGEKGLGEACSGTDECEQEMCVSFDGGASYFCTDFCQANADCPCGMKCIETVSGPSYCNLSEKDGCVPDGQPCAKDAECVSGSCVSGVCHNTCNIYQGGTSCPSGQGCKRLTSISVEGSCHPKGNSPNDSTCGTDAQCQSLFCLNGFCQQPCNEFAPNTCPTGEICRPAGSYGVCSPYVEPEVPDTGGGEAPEGTEDVSAGNVVDAGSGNLSPDVSTENLGPGSGDDNTIAPGVTADQPEDQKGPLGCSGGGSGGTWMWLAALGALSLSNRRRRSSPAP